MERSSSSVQRPKKERGRLGSEERVSADDYQLQIVHTLAKYWIVDFRKYSTAPGFEPTSKTSIPKVIITCQ
jgi:hypothetical protein